MRSPLRVIAVVVVVGETTRCASRRIRHPHIARAPAAAERAVRYLTTVRRKAWSPRTVRRDRAQRTTGTIDDGEGRAVIARGRPLGVAVDRLPHYFGRGVGQALHEWRAGQLPTAEEADGEHDADRVQRRARRHHARA